MRASGGGPKARLRLLPEGARAPPAREGFDASIPSQPHFPSENVVIYRYKGACGPRVFWGETHANLGGIGMGSYKPFGILVEGWGEGWRARRAYRRDRQPRAEIGEAKL